MKRRKLLAAASTAGAVALPGCGISEYQPDGSEPAEGSAVTSDEAETAVEHLTRIFDRLADIEVLGSDPATVVATTDTYTEAEDLAPLREELDNARTAAGNLRNSEATPSRDREIVERGIRLADARLTIYTELLVILHRERPLLEAVAASNYSVAKDQVRRAKEARHTLMFAADGVVKICEGFQEADLSAPAGYRLDAAQSKAERFVGLEVWIRPIITGLEEWTDALVQAAAGRQLLDDEEYTSAAMAFGEAAQGVDFADDWFDHVADPVIYSDAYQRAACGLRRLEDAFIAAERGASAAADGDDETANEQFQRYEEQLNEYTAECGAGN